MGFGYPKFVSNQESLSIFESNGSNNLELDFEVLQISL